MADHEKVMLDPPDLASWSTGIQVSPQSIVLLAIDAPGCEQAGLVVRLDPRYMTGDALPTEDAALGALRYMRVGPGNWKLSSSVKVGNVRLYTTVVGVLDPSEEVQS